MAQVYQRCGNCGRMVNAADSVCACGASAGSDDLAKAITLIGARHADATRRMPKTTMMNRTAPMPRWVVVFLLVLPYLLVMGWKMYHALYPLIHAGDCTCP